MKNIISQEEKNRIDEVCTKYKITNYTINPDGSIDVDGDVDFYRKRLLHIPLKLGKVSGDFYCNGNQLTSLEFCPREVSGDFNCSNNKLTSLEFCPREVGGGFYCVYNNLTSLEFCPREVRGSFSCSINRLTSLEFAPTMVGGNFNCSTNILTSLEFAPTIVGGRIMFNYNFDLNNVFQAKFGLLENDEKRIFIRYQDRYEVWYNGFNIDACQELIDEIKDGLL